MIVYLLRHGQTSYNVQKRYQGTLDIPLSEEGRARLVRASFSPELVFVSPLSRAQQTAEIVFPDAVLEVVDGLEEMCFGSFQGRTYQEMERDPDYLEWLSTRCDGPTPDGEGREGFTERTCCAFAALVERAIDAERNELVIMAHGGTQMALMSTYACPKRPYYEWCSPNAGGYVCELDASTWNENSSMQLVGTVSFERDEA